MPFEVPNSAIFSVAGIIIGAVLQHVGSWMNLRRRQTAQNQRLQSQERIRFKVESLVELFQQIDETHRVLNDKANLASKSASSIDQREFIEEIKPKVGKYREIMGRNRIHLTDDQYEDMKDVLGGFRMALNFIQWKIENGNQTPPQRIQLDWGEFKNAYEEATETLREEVDAPIEHQD